MMLAIILMAEPIGAAIDGAITSYHACITDAALDLGRGNTEPVDTIVTAAGSVCQERENSLRISLGPTMLAPSAIDRIVKMHIDRARADATLAVLRIRR